MEKDGWPYWLIDIWSYGDFFERLERRSLEVCRGSGLSEELRMCAGERLERRSTDVC